MSGPLDQLDPSTIDAVLFDVGGVFILPLPERVRAALSADDLVVPTELEQYRRAHYEGAAAYDHSYDSPETWNAYHQGYAAALGYTGAELAQAVEALTSSWHQPGIWAWRQDDAVEALIRMSELGHPLGIVSNSDGTVERTLLEEAICQVGDGDHVRMTAIVDSSVVGYEKPDPGAFAPALAALDTSPDRILFVGDTVRNDVRGAEAVGLRPVHLDPYDLYHGADHLRITDLHVLADSLSGPR